MRITIRSDEGYYAEVNVISGDSVFLNIAGQGQNGVSVAGVRPVEGVRRRLALAWWALRRKDPYLAVFEEVRVRS